MVIGPGEEITDLYFDWERLRQVQEDGVVLVRPDKHVGWRSHTLVDNPAASLREVLTSLLNRNAATTSEASATLQGAH